MIDEAIKKLVNHRNLTLQESKEAMKEIMSGTTTEAQTGAFLTALRMKGETIQEIWGFTDEMRKFHHQISPKSNGRIVDTCGTGGDTIKTFNVSTISAFVIAGAGITVAKHGNRAVTSQSGSADILEKLGLKLNLEPKTVEKLIENIGIGFMFAPRFHPAMKHVAKPRREIGIRTVFNILGPLTNPANVNAQVLGVFSKKLLNPMVTVLNHLDRQEAMVVHGTDGLDEISIIGKTLIAWLKDGEVLRLEITPKEFGFRTAMSHEITSTKTEENIEITFKLLTNKMPLNDPKRNMLLLNSAAGIIVGGKTNSFEHGIEIAIESIKSGKAYEKLKTLIKASGGKPEKLEELEEKFA